MNTDQQAADAKLREAEEWRDIEDFPEYKISNLGRVKSFKKNGERILKCSVCTTGYLQIILSNKDTRLTKKVHRIVAKTFMPNPLNKPCINHIDSNRLNARLENLEWCTYKENIAHALLVGGWRKGVDAVASKLNKQQVIEIFRSELSNVKLGKIYGVGQNTIFLVKNKYTYKNELLSEFKTTTKKA